MKTKKVSKNSKSDNTSKKKITIYDFKEDYDLLINMIPQNMVDKLNLSKSDLVKVFECYTILLLNLLTNFENEVLKSMNEFFILMSEYKIRIPKIRKVLDRQSNSYIDELDKVSDLIKLTFDILPNTIDDVLFNDYVWKGYLGISDEGIEIVRLNTKIFKNIKYQFDDTDVTKEMVVDWLTNELVENPIIFKSLIGFSEDWLKCIKENTFSLISYDDFGKKLISDIESLKSFNFENLPYILNKSVLDCIINVFEKENCMNDVKCIKDFLNLIDFSKR